MNYQTITLNLGVKNVNETADFYCNRLGFQLLMTVPEEGSLDWAMVGTEKVIIMFQEERNLKEEYKELEGTGRGCFTLYIKMKGMKEMYETVKGSDIIVKELGRTFYGVEEFAVRDNNGTILTFAEI